MPVRGVACHRHRCNAGPAGYAFPDPMQIWQTPLPLQRLHILEDPDLSMTDPETTAIGVGSLCTTLPLPPHFEHFPVPWQAMQASFLLSFMLSTPSPYIQTIESMRHSQPRIESGWGKPGVPIQERLDSRAKPASVARFMACGQSGRVTHRSGAYPGMQE